jgi:hypothetical protein
MSVLTRVLTAPCPKTPRRLHFASPVLNTFFTRHFSSFGRFGHDENANFAVQVLGYELLRRFLSILSILFRTTLEHRIYPIRRLLSVLVAPIACFCLWGRIPIMSCAFWKLYQVCRRVCFCDHGWLARIRIDAEAVRAARSLGPWSETGMEKCPRV